MREYEINNRGHNWERKENGNVNIFATIRVNTTTALNAPHVVMGFAITAKSCQIAIVKQLLTLLRWTFLLNFLQALK